MKHVFLDTIPLEIKDGVLYISIKYGTAIHKCPCGCGNEIVTPFEEKFGWIFSYNGKTLVIGIYPAKVIIG